jgi:hypothetical protein
MVLDATVGGSLADSYLTVDEADARAAADIGTFAAAWADAATEDLPAGGPNRTRKEQALRRAVLDLEGVVEHVGALWDLDQARLFPRSVDLDGSGDPFIPERVQRAQYLQAVYLFANIDVLEAAATRRARGLVSFSEPNVSGSLSTDARFGQLHPELVAVLKPLTESAVVGWIVPS